MSATDCEPLLDICTIRVYADNVFRILNAPVDVRPSRLKRHGDDLQAAIDMGTLEEEYPQFLRPHPLPTLESIRDAYHELQDSPRRFTYEFFWFWPMEPGKSASDEGLLALKTGGAKQAQAVWVAAEKNGTREGSLVARHNLAVLGHLMALAGEARILQGRHESNDIPQDHANHTNSYWQYAFKYWEALCPDETLWSLLADRIRTLGDPRLTTGFVKRFRETLPIAFDNINADIAVELARQGHYKRARMHISIMEQTNQGDDDLEVNFRRIRQPLHNRIDHAVKQATQDIQNHKKEGLTRAISLYAAAKEPLTLLAILLKKHDPSEYADAADQVAEAILVCQVAYGNETKDLRKSRSVLKNTMKLAHGATLKQRIQENIDTLDEMIKSGMFDLPEATRQMVEKANEAAGRQDLDGAIEHLKAALKIVGRDAPEQLRKNLAASLANRGIGKINRAMETMNAGMKDFQQALERLGRGYNEQDELFARRSGLSVAAFANARRQQSAGLGGDDCAKCGQAVGLFGGGVATVRLPTGGTAILCSGCAMQLQQLQERGKPSREAIASLKAGAKDLAEALQYDPASGHARKNLNEVNSILSKLGSAPVRARMPRVSSRAAARRSAQAADKRGASQRTLARPGRAKTMAWRLAAMEVTPGRAAAVIVGLFVLVMLCLGLVVALGDANTIASRWWGRGPFWLGLLTIVGGSAVISLFAFATLRGGWHRVFKSRDDIGTTALITLAPLVAYIIGVAILATIAQKTVLSRSGLAAHRREFLRPPASTESSNWPYLRGRLVVLDRHKRAVDKLFFDLPDALRATSYSDVGTVVLLAKGKERSGSYTGGAPAYVQKCKVDIVDWRESLLVGTRTFRGGKAPQTINKSASSGVGSAPKRREVVLYLLGLPRKEDKARSSEGR